VCRIYIPYVVSIVFAILFMSISYRTGVPEIGGWFNICATPPSLTLLVNHAILLGEFDSYKFNIVIWSLVHEMRISLIFPVIMYFMMKYNWKYNFLIAMSGSTLFFLIYYFYLKYLGYDITKSSTSYFLTIHYTAFFVLGALLAKCKDFLKGFYSKISKLPKLVLMVIGLLAYTYSVWFFPACIFCIY